MSPLNYDIILGAGIFSVDSAGHIDNGTGSHTVDWTLPGIRPVINLKADTLFEAGGTGTSSNPYVVM